MNAVTDESGGWYCTRHDSPLFDTDTHPWRCEFMDEGRGAGDCSFVQDDEEPENDGPAGDFLADYWSSVGGPDEPPGLDA